ncbi:MAG: glycosyltransferase family 4 protein [Bacteroidales bacterium]|jgi:glycosyltransferase involved in cell wall biosynthesis|nr:glycosyltransferase family 4 protein [Bacteroidales bacterium]
MRVLFLSLLDFESLDERNIYTDLLRQFVKNDHEVSIISPIERRKGKSERIIEISKNCEILKLRIGNIQKTNKIKKGISTLLVENQFIVGIKKHFSNRRFDLVLYVTPPITFQKVIHFIKKRDNAKSYLLLKDIFPQGAVDLGFIPGKGLLYNYFRKKEQKLYKVSDYIGTLSQRNSEYLCKHNLYIDRNKVEINPNSIEIVDNESNSDSDNVRKKLSIPKDSVLFLYGGNLGKPQGIDFLIRFLVDQKISGAFFLIVGSGTEYDKLEKALNNADKNNVRLLSQLPKFEYIELEKICDVGMIFLDRRFTIPNIPSRMLGYMAMKKPIVAATDCNTDLKDIMEDGKFGFWSEHGDFSGLMKNIELILNVEKRKKMGINSFKYLCENYDVRDSYQKIINHFI